MLASTRFRRFVLVFTGVLAAAICGCAKTGTVEGKATVNGKPAVGAAVIFSGGVNQSATAVVQADGTYQTDGVPVGPVKVALMPAMAGFGAGLPVRKGVKRAKEDLPQAAPQGSPSSAIPKRYTNVETSGLTLTVKGGHNEFDIKMTSP